MPDAAATVEPDPADSSTIRHDDPAEEVRRRLTLIGVGPGDARLLTVEAVEAVRATDVFVMLDKGESRADLLHARRAILARYADATSYRVVEIPDVERDPDVPYAAAVDAWHAERSIRLERALLDDVRDGEHAAMLVWGDPSLYDSTLRLVERVVERGVVALDSSVVPGISSVQLLVARHRITLNRVGGSVVITTGRELAAGRVEGWAGADDVVVMLDGRHTFDGLDRAGWDIYWGADLGSDDEVLVAGRLGDVADRIVELRAEARQRKGWVFDVYLLRRRHR